MVEVLRNCFPKNVFWLRARCWIDLRATPHDRARRGAEHAQRTLRDNIVFTLSEALNRQVGNRARHHATR